MTAASDGLPGSARDEGIDCARGLAMVLVVLGHSGSFAQISGMAIAFIFIFHVPAFFFISGYLLRPERFLPGRMARRILTPFLVVGLFLALVKSVSRQEDLLLALAGLAWGTGATLPSSQLWFLPALFVALLLASALARFWKKTPDTLPSAIALLALLAIAYLALHLPPLPVEALRRPGVAGPIGWPWSLDLAPLAAFYCLCGFLARQTRILDRMGIWTLVPGLLLTLACFALGARTDLNLRIATPFSISVVAALGGTLAVFMLGRLACSIRGPLAAVLSGIGRHSIMILAFHVLAQNAVVALVLSLAHGPAALVAATLAGLVVGLVAPLLLSVSFDWALARFRPAQRARV